MGQRQRRRAPGVGYGNDHVDVVLLSGKAVQNALGQMLTHAQPGLVDRHVVHDGIRPCQIDVLEDARRQGCPFGAYTGVQHPVITDEHALAGRHVTNELKAQNVQRHGLRGDHVLGAALLPKGCRGDHATIPTPMIMATAAYAPRQR